jgi:hypothetical protein
VDKNWHFLIQKSNLPWGQCYCFDNIYEKLEKLAISTQNTDIANQQFIAILGFKKKANCFF